MKELSDDTIRVEYESWLDLSDDENQIKALRGIAREAQRHSLRQMMEKLEKIFNGKYISDQFSGQLVDYEIKELIQELKNQVK